MANEHYFSESEQQDENVPFDRDDHDNDRTFYAANCHDEQQVDEETIHQSIETDILGDTSDARQLQLELLATTPAHKRRARSRYNDGNEVQEQYEQRQERSRPLLRQPGKVYESLFGSPIKPIAIQPQKQQSGCLQPTSNFVHQVTASITPLHDDATDKKPSILNRLTSWFTAPPPTPTSDSKTLHPNVGTPQQQNPSSQSGFPNKPSKALTPTWNRNHYLLLDHHYTRVLHSTTQPLPSAYMTPWSSIPSPLRKLIGTKLMTTTASLNENRTGTGSNATPQATITEQWIRIAYCFVAEAKERGVPVLCNGSFVPGEGVEEEWQTKDGQRYPVRDEVTGRVKRIKEDCWETDEGAWDVLGRVYSLWVRDEIADVRMGADEER